MKSIIKEFRKVESLKSKSDIVQNLFTTYQEFNIEVLVDELVYLLTEETNISLRHEIIFLIGKLSKHSINKHEDTIRVFSKLLKSENSIVIKHEIIEALGMIKNPRSIQIVTEYLNDHNKDIRDTAELALQELI